MKGNTIPYINRNNTDNISVLSRPLLSLNGTLVKLGLGKDSKQTSKLVSYV